eukprot:NODE_381_length_1567_cov_329.573781_g276_i0.p1 GENE.NODE_381_length_1567_cov_329.573781_g276_i0~~NODE_381_length_1567_cov_329.573781_g276_i0.p1  ORF type:complete len:452 (+),score=85.96 NODE_381_length_1567_cov_329.573781_g276_i0:26-1357(+)
MGGSVFNESSMSDPVVAKVKRLLIRSSGTDGIRLLARQFPSSYDPYVEVLITREELAAGLAAGGATLPEPELDKLYKKFEKNKNSFGLNEFLATLRGTMNSRRKAIVKRAFQRIDTNSDGFIDLRELRARYSCDRHPAVLQGLSSADEVQAEFLASFDDQTNPDGRVSREEFEAYYAGVSAAIDSDDYFVAMLKATWTLDENPEATLAGTFASSTGRARFTGMDATGRVKSTLDYTLEDKKLRLQTLNQADAVAKLVNKARLYVRAGKTACLFALGSALRLRDPPPRAGLVTAGDFYEAFATNIPQTILSMDEARTICDEYEDEGTGGIDYNRLLFDLRGDVNGIRQAAMARAFKQLSGKRDVVDLQAIRRQFQVYKHPLAAKGETTKEQLLTNFLEAFSLKNFPTGIVSIDEFEDFWLDIGSRVPDDRHFDLMMQSAWNLDS